MKDWIGLWFKIQAERGHPDLVPFYFLRLPERKVEVLTYPHRERDGVAAMKYALAQLGMSPVEPQSRAMNKPPLILRPLLALRGLQGNATRVRPKWLIFHPEKKAKGTHLCFLLLDRPAVEALNEFLQNRKISLSAYLLSKATFAVSSLFEGEPAGSWLLPVNMRSAFPERAGNCVSYVSLSVPATPEGIQAGIKESLVSYEHWSNWWIYHIGKILGYRGMRRLSARSAKTVFWIGSFTDLGDWAGVPLNDGVFAIAAPGTPNNPVGVGTIGWEGRRSISLRLHPSITEEGERVAARCLGRLKEDLVADLGESALGIELVIL